MTFQNFYRLQFDAAGCSTISDIRAASGLSRAAFSRQYGIPIRTLENWESGVNEPPVYIVRLLAFAVSSDKAAT